MDKEGLYAEVRAAVSSGGSGRGMSFYQDACQCGKRALLREQQREEGKLQDDPHFEIGEGPFVAGGVYHRLHELWRLGGDCEYDFNEPLENKSVASALELFRGWRGVWPKDFWGTTVAVEKQLPASNSGLSRVWDAMGYNVTAKLDLVVDINEDDLPRVQMRCPAIIEPGRYIVDWKTAGGKYPEAYYSGGLQAIWYPTAWDLEPETGDKPVLGTIFDIILKPRWNAKDRSFGPDKFMVYYVPYSQGSHEALHGMLEQGATNLARAKNEGKGNRAECIKFGVPDVQICQFLGNGCEGM